jgi:hypothetical protein
MQGRSLPVNPRWLVPQSEHCSAISVHGNGRAMFRLACTRDSLEMLQYALCADLINGTAPM